MRRGVVWVVVCAFGGSTDAVFCSTHTRQSFPSCCSGLCVSGCNKLAVRNSVAHSKLISCAARIAQRRIADSVYPSVYWECKGYNCPPATRYASPVM